VIVGKVVFQNSAEVPLTQYHNVIQTLTANGTDQPLDESILPGTLRRGPDFLDLQRLQLKLKRMTIDSIPITNQISRSISFGKSFHDLSGGPFGCRMISDSETKHAAASVLQHEKDEQHAEAPRWAP